MGPMSEIETPDTETRDPATGSRPRVSETLSHITETLTLAAGTPAGTPAETPAPATRVPGPESRVPALVGTETRPETRTPAKPRPARRVVRTTVVKHTGLRRPRKGTADRADGPKIPRSVRFMAGSGVALLTLIVGVMASVGQVLFAKTQGAVKMIWIGKVDITPYFAPAVFDVAVSVLFALGMSAAYKNRSPWLYWISGFALGSFSIFTNTRHQGALLFAGASGVLMLVWFLKLYGQYVDLEIAASRRAAAKPKLILSGLMLAAPRTAIRAQIISTRKDLPARVAQLNAAGRPTTERELAIRLADLYITLFDDLKAVRLREFAAKKERKEKAGRKRDAKRAARLTAWREIDRRLGLEVVDLNGIELGEVTYLKPAPEPEPAPVAPARANPAAPRPATAEVLKRTVPLKVTTAAPTSPAPGTPSLDIDKLPGLPRITDPDLRERVIRDVHHVATIITHDDLKDWFTRPEKIEKPDIKLATGMTGSGVQQRLMTLMNDLRALRVTSNNA